jgi:hypothetical protein
LIDWTERPCDKTQNGADEGDTDDLKLDHVALSRGFFPIGSREAAGVIIFVQNFSLAERFEVTIWSRFHLDNEMPHGEKETQEDSRFEASGSVGLSIWALPNVDIKGGSDEGEVEDEEKCSESTMSVDRTKEQETSTSCQILDLQQPAVLSCSTTSRGGSVEVDVGVNSKKKSESDDAENVLILELEIVSIAREESDNCEYKDIANDGDVNCHSSDLTLIERRMEIRVSVSLKVVTIALERKILIPNSLNKNQAADFCEECDEDGEKIQEGTPHRRNLGKVESFPFK